ncbi:nickel pincer cofactor biosynthesis protein LarB [Liquorilactobacillus nagelii]|uniref:nickel pincer cofactor biosynthesis protein LarB n=1 Tax=Liquorilactobacillus nagelii TaxID=82688 RepID=UPI0039ECACE1
MKQAELLNNLKKVAVHEITPQQAAEKLSEIDFTELNYAKIDTARKKRTGYPEVIYGAGKTPEQISGIATALKKQGQPVLVTRVTPEKATKVQEKVSDLNYNSTAQVMIWEPQPATHIGEIAIVTAGTSDIQVAEEAAVTAELFGNQVTRIYDVGVAGIQRLFAKLNVIRQAKVIIVIAGMEGALVSVVGGLVDQPVIAVPTSIGYGSNLNGMTPLLGMLNSCSAGISVVNIDNGFGAAYNASMINHLASKEAAR